MRLSLSLSLALLALFACNPNGGGIGDDTATDDTGAAAGDDTGTPEEDTGSSEDTTPPPPPPSVHFVVLGDAGTGDAKQSQVADVIETVCAREDRGCEFALYLGDNIYNTGAEGYEDDQFRTKFEEPYANLVIPFYAVLGNHDLGGDGLGIDLDTNKADYQIAYSNVSTKWRMPAEHYVIPSSVVPADFARFYGLNTTDVFFALGGDQESWLELETLSSTARWNIAFGHHPYISNGQHGDAGEYEGIPDIIPFSDIPRGQHVKDFIEQTMCQGQIDVYFAGHDHNRQWLGQASGCTTTFVVSGAGGKTTDFRHDGNTTEFQDDTTPGFLWAEIVGDVLTAYFYDMNGNEVGPFVVQR